MRRIHVERDRRVRLFQSGAMLSFLALVVSVLVHSLVIQGAISGDAVSLFAGYVASGLVLATFAMKDMRMLRVVAIFSNVAFIIYGTLNWLLPVLSLHVLLLPINAVRLLKLD
jgi:hypothetical protein